MPGRGSVGGRSKSDSGATAQGSELRGLQAPGRRDGGRHTTEREAHRILERRSREPLAGPRRPL